MVVDERSGHELCQRLEGSIGTDAADTLMAHLPPVGWADVATKTDLANLRALAKADLGRVRAEIAQLQERIDLRFDAFDLKIEAMGSRVIGELRKDITDAIVSQTKVFAYSLVGSIVATGSLVLAAVRLG